MPVSESDLALDRSLSELVGRVPILKMVTPTNTTEARAAFRRGEEPQFEYRELPDLREVADSLDQMSAEQADDPTIAHMAEGLLEALRLRLELLANRNTDRFFLTSVELFGHVEEQTLETARRIVETVRPHQSRYPKLDALQVAARARLEIERYREEYPEISARVKVRSETSGVMVETGDLYIGSDITVREDRIEALLHHEVGTHILTFENGRAQPLHMLSVGLARYDELQEALGVLAEFLSGNLPPGRLRILAFRVIAAHLRSGGATFREAYEALVEAGCARKTAFTTVMRAYRAGGMTKDAVYLRGLIRLLKHIEDMEKVDLTPMFVGKISFDSIPLVKDLMDRSIVSHPVLTPRFLEKETATVRMRRIRAGIDVAELTEAAA